MADRQPRLQGGRRVRRRERQVRGTLMRGQGRTDEGAGAGQGGEGGGQRASHITHTASNGLTFKPPCGCGARGAGAGTGQWRAGAGRFQASGEGRGGVRPRGGAASLPGRAGRGATAYSTLTHTCKMLCTHTQCMPPPPLPPSPAPDPDPLGLATARSSMAPRRCRYLRL